MAKDYSQIETILRAAVPHIAEKSEVTISRRIEVSDQAGGDLRVRKDAVIVHPRFATEGNPLDVVQKIIEACQAFDARVREERELVRQEARQDLERLTKRAKRLLGDEETLEIVVKELGL